MAKPVEIEILLKDRVSAGLELMQRKLEGLMAKAQGSGDRVRILEAAIGALTTRLEAMRKAGEAAGSSIDQGKNIEAVNAIEAKIKELREQLRQLDETAENTSTVPAGAGQATRQYNGLHMSVQQIARELPAATMGLNMFFLAISNNIPILTDEIKRAKAANEELKASGQSTVPVWKQLVGSIFSWQTALMVAVTVLSMYGKEIVDWTKGLVSAGKAVDALTGETARFNAAQLESRKSAGADIGQLRTLRAQAEDVSLAMETRLAAVDKLQEKYPAYLGNLSKEEILAGNASAAYQQLTEDIMTAARARAAQERIDELAGRQIQEQRGANADTNWLRQNKARYEEAAQRERRRSAIRQERENGPIGWTDEWTDEWNALKKLEAQDKVIVRQYGEINRRAENHNENISALEKQMQSYTGYINKAAEAMSKLETAGKSPAPVVTDGGGGQSMAATDAVTAAQAKVDGLTDKQARERAEREAEIEAEVAQAKTDAMADSAEKKRRQRELDNKKELDAIERQKQAYIEKEKQAQREIFEAEEDLKAKRDPDYRRRAFDAGSVSVDTGAFDELSALTRKRQAGDAIKAQEEAWREYLLKYGDYQQRRQAITEKYSEEINAATTAGDAAMLQKEMQDELDALDEEMRGSTTLMGQLFADASERSVAEIQKIIDKAELLMAWLGARKDAEDTATIDGKTVSRGDILNFGISENTLQGLERSPEKVESLRNGIARLKGEIGSRSPFKRLEEDIKAASAAIKSGDVAGGVMRIGNAVAEFAPALGEFGQSLGTIFGSDALGAKISGVADALGGVGQTASGVGQIMSGDVVGGAMAAVSGIGKVVGALDGLFGADYSEYEALKGQYDLLVDVWDDLIAKKKEYIDIDYGAEAQKAGQEALDLLEKEAEATRNLLAARGGSGSSWGSHSIAARTNDDLGGWLAELRKYTHVQDMAVFQTLQNSTADELEKIKEEMPEFWARLDYATQDYLEKLIAIEEQSDEVVESMKEAATGLSFDSLYDGYVDLLADLDADNEDFADNFEDYLMRSVLSALVADKYRERIRGLYDTWASWGEDGLDADEAEALRQMQESLAADMLADRDSLAEAFGWEGTGGGHGGGDSSYTAMSQEQGTKLEGLWTTSAMHLSSMDGTLTEVSAQMGAAADCLRQIEANTGSSAKHLGEIKEDIKKIVRDGLKVK